jgi:hypothetical protein
MPVGLLGLGQAEPRSCGADAAGATPCTVYWPMHRLLNRLRQEIPLSPPLQRGIRGIWRNDLASGHVWSFLQGSAIVGKVDSFPPDCQATHKLSLTSVCLAGLLRGAPPMRKRSDIRP